MENKINHGMVVPFRACIIGNSSCVYENNILLKLISQMNNTFDTIHIYTHYRSTPVYTFLESVIKPPSLEIYEDLNNLKNKKDFDYIGKTLIIFDGMFNENEQSYISEFYNRSRNIEGISLCYLSSYLYQISSFIRLKSQYIFFKKIPNRRTNKIILLEYWLDANEEQILAMFKYCANDNDFLLLDLEKNTYKKSFNEILDHTQF